MNVCIVENGIISNVIVASDQANPADFGGYLLPDGKWIGDIFQDELPVPTTEERVSKLENENSKLKSQLQMQAQQQEFLENCLLEMGDVVYA